MRVMRSMALAALLCALSAASGCSKPPEVAAGPPCPSTDAAGFAVFPYKPRPNTKFEYHDTIFSYALGNSQCSEVTGGGLGFTRFAVCDFSSPAALQVDHPNGQHEYYTPALGQHLTVTIKDGAAKCEIAAT